MFMHNQGSNRFFFSFHSSFWIHISHFKNQMFCCINFNIFFIDICFTFNVIFIFIFVP